MKTFILILSLCLSLIVNAQNVLFNKTYDFTSFDGGVDLISTQDENYLVASFGNRLLKINPLGDTLWSIILQNQSIFSIAEQNDGTILATGSVVDSTFYSVGLSKLSSSGDSLWSRKYESRSGIAIKIHLAASGNIFIVGYSAAVASDTSGVNARLMKIDSLGNLIIEKTVDNNQQNDAFLNFCILPDESVMCVGTTSGIGFLTYFDTIGDTVYTKLYPNFSEIDDIIPLQDGNFIMVGSSIANPFNQALITKITPNGLIIWKKWYAKNNIIFNFKRVAPIFTDLFLVGGNETDNSNPNNNSAVFMILDANGDSLWSEKYQYISGTTRDEMRSMLVTPNQGFIFTGSSLVVPNKDLWLTRIDSLDCLNFLNGCQTVQVEETKKKTNNFHFFPNPANNWLTITSIKNIGEIKVEAIDLLGKIILSENKLPHEETVKINVSSISKGIYLNLLFLIIQQMCLK